MYHVVSSLLCKLAEERATLISLHNAFVGNSPNPKRNDPIQITSLLSDVTWPSTTSYIITHHHSHVLYTHVHRPTRPAEALLPP